MAIADMFLKMTGQRQGLVKGESRDSDHKDEIDIVSWAWAARSAGYGNTGHRTYESVEVVKRVDAASTKLLSALSTNEVVTAKLSVRKAGKTPLDYFVIDLDKVRVASIRVESFESELVERIALAFEKITVTYKVQQADGTGGGGMVWSDDRRSGSG